MSEFNLDEFMARQKAIYTAALTSPRTFAFTKMKDFAGREGMGYSATVTRNGKAVGEVVDEGNGGAPYLRLMPEDRKAFLAEGEAFDAAFNPETESVEETYCSVLSLAAAIAKKRNPVLMSDDVDLSSGEFMQMNQKVSDPAVLAKFLLSERSGMADKNPHVWVKAENRFVPATDLLAD